MMEVKYIPMLPIEIEVDAVMRKYLSTHHAIAHKRAMKKKASRVARLERYGYKIPENGRELARLLRDFDYTRDYHVYNLQERGKIYTSRHNEKLRFMKAWEEECLEEEEAAILAAESFFHDHYPWDDDRDEYPILDIYFEEMEDGSDFDDLEGIEEDGFGLFCQSSDEPERERELRRLMRKRYGSVMLGPLNLS